MEKPGKSLYIPAMTRLKPFSAVIFDMDGTLLDTELVFRDIVFSVATELGFEMTDAIHLAMVGSSHEVTRALLVEAYGVAFPVAIFDEKCRFSMRERMHVAVPIKAGARELLEELRNRGIPTAVATSSRAPHAELHLGAAGLIDFFETIVTRNDVINPKPHPEPYLMAASRLGLAAGECLAIEDSFAGVRAASASGAQTIMVPDLIRADAEHTALCAAVLADLHEVRKAAFPAKIEA